MADELNKKRPPETFRVNIGEDWERKYWSEKFGCTEQQLTNAVKTVGASASSVQRYLKLHAGNFH